MQLSAMNSPSPAISLNHGLPAGTLVTTPDGDKKIEEIKTGDLVLSGVGDNLALFYKVAKLKGTQYSGPMWHIQTEENKQILVTPNHVCFAKSKDNELNKEAITLLSHYRYDIDLNSSDHTVLVVGTEKDTNGFETEDCTFSLDHAENIALEISRYKGGMEIERFAVFCKNKYFRFRPAIDIKVAMQVPVIRNGKVEETTITNITEEQYNGLVYDLDVPEARNFAANGVLVHDSTHY